MVNPTVVSLQPSDDILEVSLKCYGSTAWLSQKAMTRFLQTHACYLELPRRFRRVWREVWKRVWEEDGQNKPDRVKELRRLSAGQYFENVD